jgi:DNA modification methylase
MSAIKKDVTIGNCRLILGDCLEVMPALGKVDAVVTDPPYGIGTGKTRAGSKGLDWGVQSWDKSTVKGLERIVLSLTCPAIVWGGNYYHFPPSRCWLSWDKGQPAEWYSTAHFELAWTNLDKVAKRFLMTQVAAYSQMDKAHPSQKPLPLMRWCINHLPDTAQTILDPFMGSGTTLVACAKLGRKGIGIEMDPDYFEIACKRVQAAYDQPDLFVAPPAPATQEGFDL